MMTAEELNEELQRFDDDMYITVGEHIIPIIHPINLPDCRDDNGVIVKDGKFIKCKAR